MAKLGDPPDLNNLGAEFWESQAGKMISDLRPQLEKLATQAARETIDSAGIDIDWHLVAQEAADWAKDYSYELVRDINDTTRDVLRDKVSGYFEQEGTTIGDLRDALSVWFSDTRAEMIAVTEVTRAAWEGEKLSVAEAKRIGLEMRGIWRTNKDELVCDICSELDGKPDTEWGEYDGPPAHPRCRCWAVHEWVGEPAEAEEAEAEQADEDARPISDAETEYQDLVAQAQADEDAARAAGDTETADGIALYRKTLEEELDKEARMNDALWEYAHITPDQATADDWDRVAQQLDERGYDILKRYDKDGIVSHVASMRHAEDAGYMGVGGEMVMVKKGAFSVREGQRIVAREWEQAKREMSDAMGDFLTQVGFNPAEIAKANYQQRQSLLEELGQMALRVTSSGKPSKIDDVSPDARARVVSKIDPDAAATAGTSASDPLNLPSFGLAKLFDTAVDIRALHGG